MGELIGRYQLGKLSAEEKAKLAEWLSTSPTNRSLFRTIVSQTRSYAPGLDPSNTLRISRAFEKVTRQIDHTSRKKTVRFFPAAAAILLLCAFYGIYAFYLREYFFETVLVTRLGEHKVFRLEDGTKVWLGPATSLRFPKKFGKDRRIVHLSGEATFDIAKDNGRPFSVLSKEVETNVLGTSFKMKAYDADRIASVLVITGKVRVGVRQFQNDTKEYAVLEPGDQVTYKKWEKTLRSYANKQLLDEHTAIHQQYYDGETVSDIVRDVERFYNIQVKLDPLLYERRFFGSMDTEQTVDVFLNKLALTLNVHWHKLNKQHYIVQ